MNQVEVDPVTTAVALLTLFMGPALAKIIGPYAVIMIACTTGAAWSLGRRDVSSNPSAFVYFLRLNVTAMLVTVSLAMMAKHYGLPMDPQWLLTPIAILIGGVGDDWPSVGKFIVDRLGRLVDRKIENVGPAPRAARGIGYEDTVDIQVDDRGFRVRDGDAQ